MKHASPSAAAQRLSRVGPYDVMGAIARGGMAEVFLARLTGADGFVREVAIKRVLPEYTSDEAFIDMFRDEARITAQLRHGNIVQVLEFRQEAGEYFLVLEYIDGPSLATLLRGARTLKQPLSAAVVAFILCEVARALDYAHRKRGSDGARLGIVHRDISPSNVLVSREGHVKLADFGIARASARLSVTSSGLVKGKVSYLAPEVLSGAPADERSDIFSLGAVAWEMLAGQPPFEAETLEAKMQRILIEPLKPISTYVLGVPEVLGDIIDRMLSKRPEHRPARAGEVVEALAPLVALADVPADEDLASMVERVGAIDTAYAVTRLEGFKSPKLRALVVERSRTARALLRSALDAHFDVLEVDDAAAARAAVKEAPIALVVSQQLLAGGGTGVQLCQELRAQAGGVAVPFVLLASDASAELEARARDAGVSAVIVKGDAATLVETLRELATRVGGGSETLAVGATAPASGKA